MSTEGRKGAPLRTLHVACMPFPTPQGTQAVVGMMVRALREHGHQATLLTYAHGDTGELGDGAVTPVRLSDWPRVRSRRSGPSVGKLLLDARMVAAVRAHLRRQPADVVVAHNVEAAWACAAVTSTPVVYYAHTSMRDELPHYVAPGARRLATVAGEVLDRGACRRSAAVFALTPALAQRYAPLHGSVTTVLPPFELPRQAPVGSAHARARLGLPADAQVAVYAGNLDAYQGVAVLLDALAAAARPWRLLVATDSDHTALLASARRLGVAERVTFAPIATEGDRACAHAAADLAVVPRLAPGGLPIKLLDALSRGLPAVANRRALAGLSPGDAVAVVADDDPAAFARGVEFRLDQGGARSRSGVDAAHAELQRAGLTSPAFVARFERACESILGARNSAALATE